MNKLKYFLIIFIVLFSVPVYASEFNMNNYTSATQDGTKNRYRGVEISETGMPLTFTFGTRYTGKLSTIETYFDYPFEANTTYTLTYNMNTEDFRNNFAAKYWWDCDNNEMNATNQHLGSFTYVSYKKVKFSFKPTENTQCIRVLIGSSNMSSQAITGIRNWRLDSITLYDPAFQSGSSGGQGTSPSPSPSPSGATNQDIIDSNEENTQDIINNQNDNTQDIIENNNENTDKIIENQNNLLGSKCANLFGDYAILNGYIFDVRMSIRSGASDRLALIPCEPNTTYYISRGVITSSFRVTDYSGSTIPEMTSSYVDYTVPRVLENNNGNSLTYTTSANAKYLVIHYGNINNDSSIQLMTTLSSIMVNTGDSAKPWCEFGSYSSKLDDLNDTMRDESEPSISLDLDLNSNSPVSDLLTMPLTILNNVLDITDNTCTPYTIPFDFTGGNNTLTFPCINLEEYLGHDVYTILDTILCFYLCYEIGMMCISIYENFTSLRDSFDSLYTPKHHDTSTRVGRGEMEGKY